MRDLPVDFSLANDGGIGQLINREVVDYDAESKTVFMRFTLGDVFLNFQGVIHGGILATLLDTVCGVTIRLGYDPEEFAGHVTLELKTSFFEAAQPGVFMGEGKLLRLGKSIAFSEGVLKNEAGKVVATASATFKLRRRQSKD